MSKAKAKKSSAAIVDRNRLALAYLELAGDKVFQKLPEEDRNKLIKEVLATGDEVAGWVLAEYGTRDPRKIADRMGVKVFGEESKTLNRSQYRRESKEIIVSRRFHEKLLREVHSTELAEHLLKFVVAHELFHHLEAERVGEVYRRYKFKTWQIGPYTREKFIKGLSDVAAQAFTQTLLGLEISPRVFDYVLNFLL